jgi:hypothetical protein
VRISRLLVVTAVAVLGLAVAVAVAQTSPYTTNGSVSVKGGTKTKAKPGGLTFSFDVSDPSGNQTPPLESYSIAFEGGRMNTGLLPACTAAKINANNGDPSVCPSGSKIGSGSLNALIGTAGQPTATASPCKATLTLFAGGKGHATLLVTSELANCPTALSQAIDMQYFTKGPLAGLKFTVPQELRHQLGLDITVIHADSKINKIVKKGKGFLEATGCSDGKRDLVVTFVDEAGGSFPVTKTLGAC